MWPKRCVQGSGFFPCRFCMVYSEVPNFSEPNPEYNTQQAPNKSVSPWVWRKMGRSSQAAWCWGGSECVICAFRCRMTAAPLPLKLPRDPLPPLQVNKSISFLPLAPLSPPSPQPGEMPFPCPFSKCVSLYPSSAYLLQVPVVQRFGDPFQPPTELEYSSLLLPPVKKQKENTFSTVANDW